MSRLAEFPGTIVTLVQRGSAFARVSADAAGTHVIANDAVIVCAGGTLPREWLGQLGIAVKTHYG